MKILIIVAPYISHYYAVSSFAKKLEALGISIEICSEGSLNSTVSVDFSFCEYNFLSAFYDPNPFKIGFKALSSISNSILKRKIKFTRWNARKYILKDLISRSSPDLILADNFMPIVNGVIKNMGIPIIGLETMLCRNYSLSSYPLNVGKFSRATKHKWFWHLLRLEVRYLMSKVISINTDNLSLLKRDMVLEKLNIRDEFLKKSLFVGINVHEIILTPRHLDPFFVPEDSVVHFYVPRERIECHNEDIYNTIEKNKQLGKKIIFCSFGTLFPNTRPKNVKSFFNRLVCSSKIRDDYFFVISAAQLCDDFDSTDNIIFYETVPQLWILKHVDLFITHGGINSILESLESNVPMLVYPFDRMMDQFGNAGRVEMLKLGITGDWKDDPNKLIYRISSMLENSRVFFKAIREFNKHSLTCQDELSGRNLIEWLKQRSKKSEIV